MKSRILFSLFFAALLSFCLYHPTDGSGAQETGSASSMAGGKVSTAKAAAMTKHLVGEWVGARLLCRKEKDNAVRCGKPVEFSVTFHGGGTGSSTDEHFPNSFTYGWKSKTQMVLTPLPAGDELTLYQFDIQEGFLTFQANIYLAIQDPSLPREANYIHYIFDVHRIK